MAISAGVLVVLAVAYGDDAISAFDPAAPSTDDGESVGDDGTIESTAVPRDCSPNPPTTNEPVTATEAAVVLIELTMRYHDCADRVIVAAPDPQARWTAANAALTGDDQDAEHTVLLLAGAGQDTGLRDELQRLRPNRVTLVGFESVTGVEPADQLAGDWELDERSADPAAQAPNPPAGGDSLWVLDGPDPDLAALLTPLATSVGGTIADVGTPSSPQPLDDRLRAATTVQLIGSFTDTDVWRLESIRSGVELPGGGLSILPDEGPARRYIAFYGAPDTSLLGVLGEQDPAATLERMQPLLAEYRTDDGAVVVPTFELITTVAAAEAGDDGDYSNETAVAALRPYVDFAADNGVYVLLDLQPGRTDFLTQAKRYEELLLEPHVGLALDPEWRLEPDQVHLRQLGSVDAAEINQVSAWLADLVRQHTLPQKMLLIHQFQQSMITNRSAIEARPELSLVIQMDGQGPLGTKYGTLAALIRGGEDGPWRWGWKNFYDEDTPMATPAQTLAVDPQPVYVSYQ